MGGCGMKKEELDEELEKRMHMFDGWVGSPNHL
jgi:hypothetical protein